MKRVLFVCLGNSCRSQMAEGFAKAHGRDVMMAASAGLTPARGVAPDTMRAMSEVGIDLGPHFPKSLRQFGPIKFDLVINMSGFDLPDNPGAETRSWDIPDPVFFDYEDHCVVRDAIERQVLNLIAELRGSPVTSRRADY